jgi:hypothetical protein
MIHLNLIRSAKIWLHRVLGASLSAILLCALSGKTESLIPVEEAKSYFAQAKALSDADHGKLWGIALYGPLMFVASEDRGIVANQVDSQGALKSEDGVFTGTLPATQIFANTAFEWSGIRWTQMLWPLPEDAGLRKILIAHEMFHRIQNQLGLPNLKEGDNQHLDTRAGRYYLQLEWSALKHALEAKNKAALSRGAV